MTALVGMFCRDGVVIGADSSTTFTHGMNPTVEQSSEKIEIIGNVIVAGTGYVGLGQRFQHIIDESWKNKTFQQHHLTVGKHLSQQFLIDVNQTRISPKDLYGALVAFPSDSKTHLCEFDTTFFQPEFKTDKLWYCSMGSCQYITDSFLAHMRDVYWQHGPPTIHEGIFAVTWTLQHAISVNAGGVNGPARIAILEKKNGVFNARKIDEPELMEHMQYIEEAKKALRGLRASLQEDPKIIPPKPNL